MNFEPLWYPKREESFGRKVALSPLSVLSAAYRAGVGIRSSLYNFNLIRPRHFPKLLVISIGNLTAGGAGKTPAVIFLAQHLLAMGRKVAVLSRGYGRESRQLLRVQDDSTEAQVGDEPLLIHRRVPRAEVLVGSSRADLAQWAQSLGADTVLLDDGMQHRQLARDLDILVVDAMTEFGNHSLIPRGPLREPLSALNRVGLLWLRSESADAPVPMECRHLPVVRAAYESADLVLEDGTVAPISALAGTAVFAFGGIARPSSFLRSLERVGAKVVGSAFFKDHHRFAPRELDELISLAKAVSASLCTTEKDAVRLPLGYPARVLRLHVRLLSGQQALSDCLSQRIHSWDNAAAP